MVDYDSINGFYDNFSVNRSIVKIENFCVYENSTAGFEQNLTWKEFYFIFWR